MAVFFGNRVIFFDPEYFNLDRRGRLIYLMPGKTFFRVVSTVDAPKKIVSRVPRALSNLFVNTCPLS